MERSEARCAVLEQGWLATEDTGFQEAILERAALRHFPVGQSTFDEGDFGGGLYGIASGAFGVYVTLRNDELRLAHVSRQGVWMGNGPIIDRRRRTLGARAIEPSVVFHLPLGTIDQMIAADPTCRHRFSRISDLGIVNAIGVVSDLLIPNVEHRIASTLLRIAPVGAKPKERHRIISGLTQKQIGELANAARDVVNRTLKRLEARGWIKVSYRRIILLEPDELDAFCASATTQ